MTYPFTENDHSRMRAALEEANNAAMRDEVPIGAIITDEEGKIVARKGNKTRELSDPCAHAEVLAIRTACEAINSQRIPNYTLYVTLEPCTMCAAAISFARISRVVFGASDKKGGGVLHGGKFYNQPTCHHKPSVQHGLMAEECGEILKKFFKRKR